MAAAVIRLSDRVRCVRAPNPGPMTLEGTNTYLVGERDVLLIDPGPADERHLAAVREAVDGARVTGVFLTHRHSDHAEGARMFAGAFDAQVCAFGTDEPAEVPIADGARVGGHGMFLTALHTPGHAADQLSFVLEEERALFSGDHILGYGTTVIAWPDGDMDAYLASLRRLQPLGLARIFPGHGPVIEDPAAVLTYYIEHRIDRERQVVDALTTGPAAPPELVKRVYTDVDTSLHGIAELSLRAHLAKLEREGRAAADGETWRLA